MEIRPEVYALSTKPYKNMKEMALVAIKYLLDAVYGQCYYEVDWDLSRMYPVLSPAKTEAELEVGLKYVMNFNLFVEYEYGDVTTIKGTVPFIAVDGRWEWNNILVRVTIDDNDGLVRWGREFDDNSEVQCFMCYDPDQKPIVHMYYSMPYVTGLRRSEEVHEIDKQISFMSWGKRVTYTLK